MRVILQFKSKVIEFIRGKLVSTNAKQLYNMKEKKLELIDEDTSPLFRIMSIYNLNGQNLVFANNICAFHVGNGIVLSVAHNLRAIDRLPVLVSDSFFQNEIVAKVPAADLPLFNQHYNSIPGSAMRLFAGGGNAALIEQLALILDNSRVDRRYSRLHQTDSCKPHLVATFRNNAFCGDAALNVHFIANNSFPEPTLNRHTFLIELELLDEFVNEDIAIYRIINTHNDIINKLPSVDIDYETYDTGTANYFCLQTAPYDNLGRIINEARIEGLFDNFNQQFDSVGNSYIMDGLRYLIKGYFRFGSSGSPYLIYDNETGKFKVNAVQSQASYIQLSIGGQMDGNMQFVNGVATPLSLIETRLKERILESE